jgi:ketopantoate reductase
VGEAKFLFIGPGAIGASVAAWVAENYPSVFIMGHGETQAALRQNGITTYAFEQPNETRRTVRVATVDRPADLGDVDIVVLAVKNYSLEAVASRYARSWAIGRLWCRWPTASTISACCRSFSAR